MTLTATMGDRETEGRRVRELDLLRAIVGDAAVLTGTDMVPHLTDWTGRFKDGAALAVVRPADTAQVVAIVKLAAAHGLAIVPQGGNTGAVAGAIANCADRAVVLQLGRMRAIRERDPATPAAIVEAGCILADVQDAVRDMGLAVPLGIGSEGSATIGGLVATNAGGIQAVRFGVMRNQVLGLEVVLPDGSVLDLLRTVQKDNMGYDLKQLFIGAEGTLGIVTAVALRLTPLPRQSVSAFLAVGSAADALEVLRSVRLECGDVVVACELIQHELLTLAARTRPQFAALVGQPAPFYLLVEVATPSVRQNLVESFEAALAELIERNVVRDGTVAASEAQRAGLWLLREAIVVDQRLAGEAVRFDIALPLVAVSAFLAEVATISEAVLPGSRPMSFGHIGDGNIHLLIAQPPGDPAGLLARKQHLADEIHRLTIAMRGSICAEHGVGRKLKAETAEALGAANVAVMRAIKNAIDPADRLNPGVLIA